MADNQDWSTSSNDAVQIRLRHSSHHVKDYDQTCSPAFTYPIFGDEETIFGYKGLRVRVDFTADTLRPAVDISYSEKYAGVGDAEADDVEEKLAPFLTPSDDAEAPQEGSGPFEPPGKLLHQYEIDGRTYGVWTSLLGDPATKRIVRNMQILIPLFIEGGVPIELDDPEWTIGRWRVFFIYAIDPWPKRPGELLYTFVGYCTCYRLFYVSREVQANSSAQHSQQDFPQDTKDTSNQLFQSTYPSRERISQFLILPPYQQVGHGSRLYSLLMDHFLQDTTIRFVTVEDPNENFDDMRDVNDLVRLRRTSKEFLAFKIDTSVRLPGSRREKLPTAALVDRAGLERVRLEGKLVARQFARLVEMQLLSQIPSSHRNTARLTRKDRATDAQDRAYYFWRLLVKQRLTLHNRDTLAQLDVAERIDKLDATLQGVERDYLRLLGIADRRQARQARDDAEEAFAARQDGAAHAKLEMELNGTSSKARRPKRVIEDDDDDVDDAGDDRASSSSKRARMR